MKGDFKKENFLLLHSCSGYVLPCLQEMRAGTEKPKTAPSLTESFPEQQFFFCPFFPHDHSWSPFSAPSHSGDLPLLLGKGQNSQHASHNLSLPTLPTSSPLLNYGIETKFMPPGCFKNHY